MKPKKKNRLPMQSFEIESYLQLDEFRLEIQRRDQEVLAMAAKMKTLEEQHQVIDWQSELTHTHTQFHANEFRILFSGVLI